MGFRFRRTIRVMPGVRLNIGKRGISTSIGVRGAHFTIGSTGVRKTVGLPGTGLSWTTHTPPRPPEMLTLEAANDQSTARGRLMIFILIIGVVALVAVGIATRG